MAKPQGAMPRLISPAVISAPENVNFCLAAIQLFANVIPVIYSAALSAAEKRALEFGDHSHFRLEQSFLGSYSRGGP